MKTINAISLLVAVTIFSPLSGRSEPLIERGDRVAILGDSITEQKKYSVFIDAYLTLSNPQLDVSVMQFGWGGETAPVFLRRMEDAVLPWKPTVATLCYGMNDGKYKKYEPAVGEDYRVAMAGIVSKLKAQDVRVLVGSPGVVDTFTFRRSNVSAEEYNQSLKSLGAIGKDIADKEGQRFADVHALMATTMEKTKVDFGKEYHVAGADGLHPWDNGQFLMAHAFLEQMGFDGEIAMIEMNMNGKTKVSSGHSVISEDRGKVKIESSRYPFCFYDNPDKKRGILEIAKYTDFNQKLNRFSLKVDGINTTMAKVVWGQFEKEFSAERLKLGVNLAAEFPQNPFSIPFIQMTRQIAIKQMFETGLIKQTVSQLVQSKGRDPYIAKHYESTYQSLLKLHQIQVDRIVEQFKSVDHEITVIPIQ